MQVPWTRKLTVLTVLLLVPTVLASHYGGDADEACGEPGATPILTLPQDHATTTYPVYVSFDAVASDGYLYAISIYAESNGVDGLQRFDSYCYTPGYGHWEADTLFS